MSLIEVTIVSAIGAGIMLGAGAGIKVLASTRNNSKAQFEARADAVNAFAAIMKVGRVAMACNRSALSLGEEWLICTVDENIPSTAVTTDDVTYRFGMVGGHLEWQKLSGAKYETRLSFGSVVSFRVCDDAIMASQAGCAIPGTAISRAHVNDLAAAGSSVNRFFRFQLSAASGPSHIMRQGSFMVRHPSIDGIRYQWGLSDNSLAGGG